MLDCNWGSSSTSVFTCPCGVEGQVPGSCVTLPHWAHAGWAALAHVAWNHRIMQGDFVLLHTVALEQHIFAETIEVTIIGTSEFIWPLEYKTYILRTLKQTIRSSRSNARVF